MPRALTCLTVVGGLLAAPTVATADLVVDQASLGGPCSDARTVEQVSPLTPWCTLPRAVVAAPSGSLVTVRAATYPPLSVTGDRTRDSAVTFRAAALEQVAVGRITLTNSSHLAFEAMALPAGVDARTNSDHVRFAGNAISAGVNVTAGSNNVAVEGNTIRNDSGNAINFSSTSALAPISDVTIRGNRIVRAVADGMQLKNFRNVVVDGNEISGVARVDPAQHSDVLQTVFGGRGLMFRNNYVHDNAAGILVKDGATGGVVIENNLIVDNDGDGTSYAIQVWDSAGPRIVNNTVWNNRYGVVQRSGTTGAVVFNNIAQSLRVVEGATTARMDSNLTAGPLFVDLPRRDYRLVAGSPGIDEGSRVDAPTTDIDGLPRGQQPDIGAYEYVAPAPLPAPAPSLQPERRFAPPPLRRTGSSVPLTGRIAKATATAALKKRVGKPYVRGRHKRLACRKLAANRYECRASWRYRRATYSGRVIVAGDANNRRIIVQVRRR